MTLEFDHGQEKLSAAAKKSWAFNSGLVSARRNEPFQAPKMISDDPDLHEEWIKGYQAALHY